MAIDIKLFVQLYVTILAVYLGMFILSRFYINTTKRKTLLQTALAVMIPLGFIGFYVIYHQFQSFLYLLLIVIGSTYIVNNYNSVPIIRPSLRPPMRFEDKVKRDLGLEYVKSIKTEFPEKLKWVGGFMTPILPFLTVTNTNIEWNARRKEAIVHEMMHIKIMLGGYLLVLLMVPLLAVYGIKTLIPASSDFVLEVISGIVVVVLLVYNEYITDVSVRKYTAGTDIETMPLTLDRYMKYVIIYGIYIFTFILGASIVRWLR